MAAALPLRPACTAVFLLRADKSSGCAITRRAGSLGNPLADAALLWDDRSWVDVDQSSRRPDSAGTRFGTFEQSAAVPICCVAFFSHTAQLCSVHGNGDGTKVGGSVGGRVGLGVGSAEGTAVGVRVGCTVGINDGSGVG